MQAPHIRSPESNTLNYPVKTAIREENALFNPLLIAHGTPHAQWLGMIFLNVIHPDLGGISGFYDEAVTNVYRTGKGLAKSVKYVNNFGQLPACNCSLAP